MRTFILNIKKYHKYVKPYHVDYGLFMMKNCS